MKRRREMEKGSEIKSAIEELSMMVKLKPSDNQDAAAHIPTKPFLYVCNLFVQVLGRSSLSLFSLSHSSSSTCTCRNSHNPSVE